MEIWKLLALITIMSVLICSAHGMSFSLDKERWITKNWEDQPLVERIAGEVASLIKRSKSRQFYGLMGKRAGNKGEMFVGLMGRRSLVGEHRINSPYIGCQSIAEPAGVSVAHVRDARPREEAPPRPRSGGLEC